MKHVTPLSRMPLVAEFSILGTRAFISMLADIVGVLSGISALIKGEPVDGGNGDGDGDEHADM